MPNKPKVPLKVLKDLGADQIRELLPAGKLAHGSHNDPTTSNNKQLCVMEAVAYITGEPHSYHPKCADPVLTDLAIVFNDSHYGNSRNGISKAQERDELITAIPA